MNKKQQCGNSYSEIVENANGVKVYRKSFALSRKYQFYNEYLCSRYLQALDSDITPQIISVNHAKHCIDYELCNNAEDNQSSNLEYLELTKKVHSLCSLRENPTLEINASQPMIDLKEFFLELGDRIRDLEDLSSGEEASTIELKRLIRDMKGKFIELQEALAHQYLRSTLTFSQADSGVHNCVRGAHGGLLMADLEYAGKDSPLKQCIDYLLHPRCQTCTDTHKDWWQYFNERVFSKADNKVSNIVASALSLKWAVIMLNEYRPDIWTLRVTADESRAMRKAGILKRQLVKASLYFKMCDRLKVSEVPYGLFSESERDFLSESY
jgi:hypothetical protein